MRRAPAVLAATAAGTAALLSFHPHRSAATLPGAPTGAGAAGARSVSGAVQETRYGPVQVRIVVRAGKLSDVIATQLPQNDPRSSQISTYAARLLRQEALGARSASIDTISGASYTSDGYRSSLAAALQSAGL